MASATQVINRLIASGVIPREYKRTAITELHRELSRRSRRTVLVLASLTSMNQMALRIAAKSA